MSSVPGRRFCIRWIFDTVDITKAGRLSPRRWASIFERSPLLFGTRFSWLGPCCLRLVLTHSLFHRTLSIRLSWESSQWVKHIKSGCCAFSPSLVFAYWFALPQTFPTAISFSNNFVLPKFLARLRTFLFLLYPGDRGAPWANNLRAHPKNSCRFACFCKNFGCLGWSRWGCRLVALA